MGGVTLGSFDIVITTTAAQIGSPDFKIRFTEEKWFSGTPTLKAITTSTIEIHYIDQCGDTTISSLTPFTVLDMETSVLRTISEVSTYPYLALDATWNPSNLADKRQEI